MQIASSFSVTDQKIPERFFKIMFLGSLKLQVDQIFNLGFSITGFCPD